MYQLDFPHVPLIFLTIFLLLENYIFIIKVCTQVDSIEIVDNKLSFYYKKIKGTCGKSIGQYIFVDELTNSYILVFFNTSIKIYFIIQVN